ncbi:hypothetical protein ACKLNR_015388 [Fusarium oxysporum f. sp. zingiberi]
MKPKLENFAILFLASTAQAQTGIGQASNFNISSEVAQFYGCNETCQQVLAIANAADLETLGTAFDFDFYATADNFSTSKPGDLPKLAAIDSSHLNVPAGMASVRFQYTSRDLDGSPVPSTGFIAFPFAKPTQGRKFPLVADSHGTIGVFRGCAPSSSPSIFNYDKWVPLLYRGYAIVATDYVGLGNNYTTHSYSSYAAHANDIYYSVQAARKAFPGVFTKEWMSIGHSQGGGAFVLTAEMGMFVYGVRQVFPNYSPLRVAEAMEQRISLATVAQFCTLAFMSMSFTLTRDELVVPDQSPATDETLKEFQAINTPAQGVSASRPLLLIHGWNDTSMLPQGTVEAYYESVAAGNEVHLFRYPGGSASPLEYWILRDDGTIQSPWVRTDGGPALPPGQQPTAPGPNPVDDGQQQSQWRPDQFVS